MPEHADEPLLPQQQQSEPPPPEAEGDAGGRRSCRRITWSILALAFLLFTLNCGVAVYQGQRVSVFVSDCLLGLVICLKYYDKAEPGSQLRDRLKVAIWLLMTALALFFAYNVATAMHPAVAVVACLMALGTVAGGSYYLPDP